MLVEIGESRTIVRQHQVTGKTAFRVLNTIGCDSDAAMEFMEKNRFDFNVEEFIAEAIRHNWTLKSVYIVLKTDCEIHNSNLKLVIGKQYGFL